MDPHSSVQPPKERQAEWLEVLGDFDVHCHDRIKLDPTAFHVALPVHVLDAPSSDRFRAEQLQPRNKDAVYSPEFADAAGLHRFTEVFFNAHHTLALVEQGMWCGGLCGNWTWVVLERKDDGWHVLPWVHTFMVS